MTGHELAATHAEALAMPAMPSWAKMFLQMAVPIALGFVDRAPGLTADEKATIRKGVELLMARLGVL